MLKQRRWKKPLQMGSAFVLLMLVGAGLWWFVKAQRHPADQTDRVTVEPQDRGSAIPTRQPTSLVTEGEVPPAVDSSVLPLVSLSISQRKPQLELIASQGNGLDQNRARYLLAVDSIEQGNGEAALLWLQGLEEEYQKLAPQIVLKRAQAYQLNAERDRAADTLRTLIERYPDSPVAAEALYQLGQTQPIYWQQLIAQFPRHPYAHEVARQQLAENPDQPELLLLLARHTPLAEGMDAARDRLVNEYAAQLTPQDWEAIADGYWQRWQYGEAAKAYANSPTTARNLYRTARGYHIAGQTETAKTFYQQLFTRFPDAEDTGLGLRRYALLLPAKEAIPYLDRAINQFPDQAPDALIEKAKLLDSLGSPQLAEQTRKILLTRYSNSEAAAEYRWQQAQRYEQAGDLALAWHWAAQITQHNPSSSLAPEAGFWIGKWATALGQTDEAQTAYEQVIARHSESYFAWRSAVHLGWDVGDFTSLRDRIPEVVKPTTRSLPPAGSASIRELYQLGQDQDAWRLWEAEVGDRQQLTVPEQFTDGILELARGNHLVGINQIWSLKQQDSPDSKSQWKALRQQPAYWHALFPFPFNDTILTWSKQRQLNPLLTTALIRQESRFEPEIKSSAGAVGLMQVMPSTGEWVASKINLTQYSLADPEDNVKLGTWYLDFTHQEYDNHSLLAVASYNAGPGNVAQWVRKYSLSDPDVFVEQIPFPETQGYVEAVFGNYWNYLRLYNPQVSQLVTQLQAEQ